MESGCSVRDVDTHMDGGALWLYQGPYAAQYRSSRLPPKFSPKNPCSPHLLPMDSGAPHGVTGSVVASSSSGVKKLKLTIGMTPRPAAIYKPFVDLAQNEDGVIQAMVCRSWEAKNPSGKYLGTEYIFGDAQGSALHCIARSSIAHCVVPKLEVGHIYNISKFSLAPNKQTYRIRRHDEFLIHLEGNTIITPLDCPSSGFVRHPFQLQPLDEIAFNGNKFLIDVVGRVVNLGALKSTPKGSQYIDFHLIDERSKTIKVTLWGGLCTEMLGRFGDPDKCSIVVLPAMSIRDYRGSFTCPVHQELLFLIVVRFQLLPPYRALCGKHPFHPPPTWARCCSCYSLVVNKRKITPWRRSHLFVKSRLLEYDHVTAGITTHVVLTGAKKV